MTEFHSHFLKIIIYARYSDSAQGHGSSLERQIGEMLALIAGDPPLSRLPVEILTDEGRSAFHGANRLPTAAFGQFEGEVRDGVHNRTLLLLEHMDRLTRQGHEADFDLVRDLIKNGVTIRSLRGDLYPAGQPITLAQVISGAVRAETAREESQKKSDRTASNWKIRRKRAKADGTVLTALTAPWIEVSENKKPVARADRADLVLRWFLMAEAGAGDITICKAMERDGIEPWQRFKGRSAKVWSRGFISRTLRNREVVGEFHPKVPGPGGKRIPDPEGPWVGHYPVIVPPDLFARVRALAQPRKETAGGRKSAKLVNLFSTLVKCSKCGATMQYAKGRSEGTKVPTKSGGWTTYKRDNGSLVCPVATMSKNVVAPKCSNGAYLAYLTLEDAVLDNCLHLALDDTAFSSRSEIGRLGSTIADRERLAELAEAKAKRLWGAWSDGGSEMAMALAQTTEAEAKTLRANIQALVEQREGARGRANSQEHIRRVADVRADLYHGDLEVRAAARRKVAVHLRSLVQRIEFDGTRTTIFAAQGHLLLTLGRKGNVLSAYDLMKNGSQFPAILADYASRRLAAIAETGSVIRRRELTPCGV